MCRWVHIMQKDEFEKKDVEGKVEKSTLLYSKNDGMVTQDGRKEFIKSTKLLIVYRISQEAP